MLSLAKFLEMLVYSPLLSQLDVALCTHTAAGDAQTNIVRLFGYGARHVAFSLSRVDDVFELQVPRLQLAARPPKPAEDQPPPGEEEKRVLRAEIKAWWQAVAEHLDRLVGHARVSFGGLTDG
jgi:1-phosphatidylinositol-3-phosphate 5-kinase